MAAAIAKTMTITPIARYVSMSELEMAGCTFEVGAGELDDVDATVAYVEADDE